MGHELIDSFTYTLMVLQKNAETAYYLLKFSHMEGSNLQATFNESEGFSGKVQVHDMAGNLSSLIYMEQGELISMITAADFSGQKMGKSNCDAIRSSVLETNSIYDFENPNCNVGGGGRNVRVRVNHYTDWYNYRGNGVWEYSGNSTFEGTTYEYVWVPGNNQSPGIVQRHVPEEYPGASGPNYNTADFYNWFYENREEALAEKESILESMDEFEEKIVDSQLRPCLKKSLMTSKLFKQVLDTL